MKAQKVLMAILVAPLLVTLTCGAQSQETCVFSFEGDLALEIQSPPNAKTSVANASDRNPNADLDGIATITSDSFELFVNVYAVPSNWNDEILLNFMRAELTVPVSSNSSDLRIIDSPDALLTFPGEKAGFYQTIRVVNDFAGEELLVHSGGFVVDGQWIDLMFSTPADDPAPVELFLRFTEGISIIRPLDSSFLGPEVLSPKRLAAIQVE